MLQFTQLLTPEAIRQGVICSSKKRALEIISRLAVEQRLQKNPEKSAALVDEIKCFENLCSREKLGNTTLGNGVAIPRAKLPMDEEIIAVFLQLETPIDYDAADNREVDLLFALLIPEDMCGGFSKQLPELVERLSDKTLCKQLRNAQNEQEIWEIFECADNAFAEKYQVDKNGENHHQNSEADNQNTTSA